MAVLRYLLTPFLCTTDTAESLAASFSSSLSSTAATTDWSSDEEAYRDDDDKDELDTDVICGGCAATPAASPSAAARVRREADDDDSSKSAAAATRSHARCAAMPCRADCDVCTAQEPAANETDRHTMCTTAASSSSPSLLLPPPSYTHRTSPHHHRTHRRRYIVYNTQQPQPGRTRCSATKTMPFWSRLLCQPEVYDPCVEAAPMAETLRLRRAMATRLPAATHDTHAASATEAAQPCAQCVTLRRGEAATATASVSRKADTASQPLPHITGAATTATATATTLDMHSSDATCQPRGDTTPHTPAKKDKLTPAATTTIADTSFPSAATATTTTTAYAVAAVRLTCAPRGFRVQDTRFMQSTPPPHVRMAVAPAAHSAPSAAQRQQPLTIATQCVRDTQLCHAAQSVTHNACRTTDVASLRLPASLATTSSSSAAAAVAQERLVCDDECEAATAEAQALLLRRHWAVLQAERTRREELRRVRAEQRQAEYAAWRDLCVTRAPQAQVMLVGSVAEIHTHGEHRDGEATTTTTTARARANDDAERRQASCTAETDEAAAAEEEGCADDALPLSTRTVATTLTTTAATDEEEEDTQGAGQRREAALARRRLARCCGNVRETLGSSRRYLESAVLSQRSQQVYALLALLREARSHAWALSCRLMQLYYYYIHPILQLTASETYAASGASSSSFSSHGRAEELTAALLTRSTSAAVRAIHMQYLYDTRVTLDYQLFKYIFDRTWNRLMHDVRGYLGTCGHAMLCREGITVCQAQQDRGSNNNNTNIRPCVHEAQPSCAMTAAMKQDKEHAPHRASDRHACHEAEQCSAACCKSYITPPPPPPLSTTITITTTGNSVDGDVVLPLLQQTRYNEGQSQGSVRYAATVLYALELFERQHSLQCAVHEAERWIAWYYATPAARRCAAVSSASEDGTTGRATRSRAGAAFADADVCGTADAATQPTVHEECIAHAAAAAMAARGDTAAQSTTDEATCHATTCCSCGGGDEQDEGGSLSCTVSSASPMGLSLSASLPQTPRPHTDTSHNHNTDNEDDDGQHASLLSSCSSTATAAGCEVGGAPVCVSCSHLPMQWHKAQEDALRETVNEERRWRRLCTVVAANHALQAQHSCM